MRRATWLWTKLSAREQFPAAMFSGMFGFGPREFFNVGEENRATLEQAPQVKFS